MKHIYHSFKYLKMENQEEYQIDNIYSLLILLVVAIALPLLFPFKVRGYDNKYVSLLVSVLFFPAYLVIITIQNPIVDRQGNSRPFLTFLLLVLFWPGIFFFIQDKGKFDTDYTTSSKIVNYV